jgi:hypothetical protein
MAELRGVNCDDCCRVFKTSKTLRQHRRGGVCLLEFDDPVCCPHCGGKYHHRQNMARHAAKCLRRPPAAADPDVAAHDEGVAGGVAAARDRGAAAGGAAANGRGIAGGRDGIGRDRIDNHAERDIHIYQGANIEEIIAAITPALLGTTFERMEVQKEVVSLLRGLQEMLSEIKDSIEKSRKPDCIDMEADQQQRAAEAVAKESVEARSRPAFARVSATVLADSAESCGADPMGVLTPENTAAAAWHCHTMVTDPRQRNAVLEAHPSAAGTAVRRRLLSPDEYFAAITGPLESIGLSAADPRVRNRALYRKYDGVPHASRIVLYKSHEPSMKRVRADAVVAVRVDRRDKQRNKKRAARHKARLDAAE